MPDSTVAAEPTPVTERQGAALEGGGRETPATTGSSRRADRAAMCLVTLCRGCCCGTAKVPGVDHEGQFGTLRRLLAAAPARVRTSECLGPCSHANIVVVHPSAHGRRRGGRPVWLGLVNDDGFLADIAVWVEAGGPGIAAPPDTLELLVFTPPPRKHK